MPSKKRKIAEEARLGRKNKVLLDFDNICNANGVRRKWLPDTVFVGLINKLYQSNVTNTELNNALRLAGKTDGFFVKDLQTTDRSRPDKLSRRIKFYYCCNKGELPEIDFGQW